MRADREKLQQILLNLLSNAIKFTPARRQRSIRSTCAADGGAVRDHRVSDTGRGIPPDKLERDLRAVRAGRPRAARATQEGVGLGLAISRDLARGMGGDLTAESTPGVGARSR